MRQLLRFEETDIAVSIIARWRKRNAQVIIIVDQFEELFTLCPPEVQSRFAELLGCMVVEADVHVLLSMRDDFLSQCIQPALAPLFSELTPLHPLTDAALRRALVQPALKCGYRFEEESLAEEMIIEVSEERGALPLLAFAAAQLWERRDRKHGRLTRESYDAIGGVGGALAQHAEATLKKIGSDRLPIVRELFRNLVTAQGTRAARDVEELLSVFEDVDAARDVLRELIDARLLTSFEVSAGEEEKGRHRVEIIHESLLSAWPRLVRWQTQDQEGAQLRDELRQAAQSWEQHNRSADRLWTGTALREFQLWRERYSGGLTTTEEAFAQEMVRQAHRKRRRRRVAAASVFTFLLGVLAVVGVSRQQAVWQARRAEASRLVALGRLEMESYPTATLAYARKSLEVADNAEARLLALEALWRGPTPRILPVGSGGTMSAAFSPDGRWLAARTLSENMLLFPEDGSTPLVIGGYETPNGPRPTAFTPEGDALLTMQWRSTEQYGNIRMVSVPDGREIRLLAPESPSDGLRWHRQLATLRQGILLGVPDDADSNVYRLEIWPYEGGSPQVVGGFRMPRWWLVEPGGAQLALRRGERILIRPVAGPATALEREIATVAEGRLRSLQFSPQGDRLAVGEETGRLALWPLDPDAPREPRVLHQEKPDVHFTPAFDAEGSHIVWGSSSDGVSLWRLDGPTSAEPMALRRGDVPQNKQGVFHPRGDWLAVTNYTSITLWAIRQPHPFALRGHSSTVWNVSFTQDSNWLISCGQSAGVRAWPLDPQVGSPLLIEGVGGCQGLAVAPDGSQILLGNPQHARVVSLPGSGVLQLTGRFPDGGIYGVAFDASGRRAALSPLLSQGPPKKIRIWDLESDDLVRELPLAPPGETEEQLDWGIKQLAFTPGGELLAAGDRGIRRFDTETGRSEWIWRLEPGWEASMGLSQDGRCLLATAWLRASTGSEDNPVVFFDLAEGTRRPITSHGNRVRAVALDPSGIIVVTGDEEGTVRVGPADGGEPHLLLGHSGALAPFSPLAVSPDGQWIASGAGSEVRLWPMPDLTKPPLHTIPLEQLLAKLHELTNLQVIEDEASPTGYRLEIGPFPGWEKMPEW
jgi:WD40 repeat protein